MIYCMSDIHGEMDRWNKMLELIQFSDTDTLYFLGDAIDRKPHGIEVLQDIMRRPNVHMILGNHEQMMLDSFWSNNTYDARHLWKNNGGGSSYKTMVYKIPTDERLRILRFIQELPDHLEIEVNGRAFYLVHGYIGENRHERIWGRPEPPPKEVPIPGKTVIVGHTPTYYMIQYSDGFDESAALKIFHAPGFIDLDCGCGNNTNQRRLACLRLDDMMEFYVSRRIMIYYISDLHFGHRNVIAMDGRPFETIEEMDATLIRLWNERVTDEDDVYIVGDFAYRNNYTATWYLRQLKGRKHLIIGNHDRHTIQDTKAMECFASVEKMARVVDNDRVVSLCHFPVAEWNGKRYGGYHVHGHIHVRRDDVYEFMSRYDKALNAGCMINGYRPVTLDELIENNLRFRQEAGKETA